MRHSLIVVSAFASALLPSTVFAQATVQTGGLDLQLFKPTKDNIGFLTTSQTGVLGHLELNGNIFMNYADRPLEVGRVSTNERIEGVIEGLTTLDAALTLGLFDVASVSLGLPLTVNQDRSGSLFESDATERGFNDVELTGKVRLVERNYDDEDFVGLGVLANVGIPTGDEDALLGAGGVVLDGVLLVDVETTRDLAVAANLGYRFRADDATLDDLTFGDQVTFKFGAGYRLRKIDYLKRWEVMGEVFGSTVATDLFQQGRETPIEALAGLRRYTDDGWIFNFGFGAGLSKGVGAPDWRAIFGVTFYPFSEPEPRCPACPDCPVAECEPPPPQDPVVSDEPKCPVVEEPKVEPSRPVNCADPNEDFDGFEDNDGCADPDNDRDGVLDVDDKCPLLAEDIDAFEDEDGCPEEGAGRVALVGRQIEILDNVYFKTASDEIDLTRSEPILNDVATVLLNNPWILKLEVQGHTDNRGSAKYNLGLSGQRAAAVLEYLVTKGVARDRLNFRGFGESSPRQSNDTADGRASNRRVEFLILEREGEGEVELRDSGATLNDE